MKPFPRYTQPLLLASTIAALAACGGGGGSTTSSGGSGGDDTGSFSLSVTDAAVDSANQVVVEFSGVAIQPADGETIEFNFDEPKSIDLLALQGSASESLLSDEEVPTGDYEWIRLDVNAENDGVTDSFLELSDGTMVELWVPSGSETGLKLNSGFTVTASGSTDFTIDFDLRKSVVLPPNNAVGGAILKPALRLVDNTSVGAIAGSVDGELITELCADPATNTGAVYVFAGADATVTDVRPNDETDPVTTALVTDESGSFAYEAGFLSEGDYTLAYTCDAAEDAPEAEDSLTFVGQTNASVEADSTTEVNFDSESEATAGTMSLDVTDGPVDKATQVVIQFDAVELGASEDTEGQVIEFDEPQSFNLLEFQGRNSASLFANETLPAGSYSFIRLMINAESDDEFDSFIEFEDGTREELVLPGDAATGLQLSGPFEVTAGEAQAFVVDFDLRKSVISNPNMPQTFLRPALRIVNKGEASHAKGSVDAGLLEDEECASGVAVYAFSGTEAQLGELGGTNEPMASADVKTDAEGNASYELGFLEPGDYTIALTCQADLDDPEKGQDGIEFKQEGSVSVTAAAEANSNLSAL